MKKLRFLIFAILITCCLAALAGCGLPKLSTPVDLKVDEATLVLSWRKITNAKRYKVSIDGEERDCKNNSYSLINLKEGEYTLRVKAVGDGEETQDSKWSNEISFVREAEPGLEFKLKNKTEYEVSGLGSATGDIVIPEVYRGKRVTSIGERAFSNKAMLTGVTLSENIEKIGAYAFAQCAFLTHINLPDTVKEIGAGAFQGCRSIEGEIVIPQKVTVINEGLFEYCSKITSVKMHDNITAIGKNAFADCRLLAKIEIGNGVTEIGEAAFTGCRGATELSLGRDLLTIGKYAFSGCSGLTKVTVANKVSVIGENAFENCSELTEVYIGSSVKEVGTSAFLSCKKLETVNGLENVQKMGAYAFLYTALYENSENLVYAGNWLLGFKDNELFTNTLLEESYFKENMVGIACRAFSGLKNVNDIRLPDSVRFINDYAFNGCEALATITIGSGVTKLGDYAFANCKVLNAVYLGSYSESASNHIGDSNLEYIGSYAFLNCEKLEKITIPTTVTQIATYAFDGTGIYNQSSGAVYAGEDSNRWLVGNNKSVGGAVNTILNGTVGIADYSFYNASNVTYDLVIPDSVKTIGRGAFYGSTVIKVTLPAGLTEIKDYTFYNCSVLQLNKIPETVTRIGRSAFYGCQMLGGMDLLEDKDIIEFTIPDSVTEIGDYAFYGCGMTQEQDGEVFTLGINILNIGNGVQKIGDNAFTGMVNLHNVTIGNGVTDFGKRAFADCVKLETVTFGSSMYSVPDRMFYGCTSLKKIVIPSHIKHIGSYAFYKCEQLEEVVVSEGVESIGDYAFYGSAVKTVTLPKSLTKIGKQSFRNCANLTGIVLTENITEIDAHAFYGCSDITFYTTLTAQPQTWHERWNSAYRPVVWGVTLAEDGYVASFVKTQTSVTNIQRAATAPCRAGYTFAGWATQAGGNVVYAADKLAEVPDGTTLYSVWTEGEIKQPEEQPEQKPEA